ncbi:MAG TPA: anti-sigma factor [Jatrophihabitans sp.]|nr:anti-sigma factor [Jatrophihabitans sp.]
MNDDERVAYLHGDPGARPDPAGRPGLDDLRRLLADPAVWAEPDGSLGARVEAAVGARGRPPPGAHGVPWLAYAIAGIAAVLLVAVAVGAVVSDRAAEPVHYAAVLVGTGSAPHASGRASLTRTPGGWRIELRATGLARRADGAYYQAWLGSERGALVPVGTFNQADGTQAIVLWAGVPPTGFPALVVTRELANGSPGSSGQIVLSGTARVRG